MNAVLSFNNKKLNLSNDNFINVGSRNFYGQLDDNDWRYSFAMLDVTLMNHRNYGSSLTVVSNNHRINVSIKVKKANAFKNLMRQIEGNANFRVDDLSLKHICLEYAYPKHKKIILSSDVDKDELIALLNKGE